MLNFEYDKELDIDKYHAAILRVLEGLRYAYEWVPIKKLYEKLEYKNRRMIYKKIRELIKKHAIKFSWIAQYKDYGLKITNKGITLICIWDYKKNLVIKNLGTKVGEGKEAIILSAIGHDNNWLIIKIYKYNSSFRKIKKSVLYSSVVWRIKVLKIPEYKIDIPKARAQVEFYVLKKLNKKNYPVPRVIGINRNSLVMEMIYDTPGLPAPKLSSVLLSNPKTILKDILEIYQEIYKKEKIVHGDLSPENILYKLSTNNFYIIDWGQAVPSSYREAKIMYQRDIRNLVEYFKRKYNITLKFSSFDI